MRLFYLVATLFVALALIILATAQFGSTCTWNLIDTGASPVVVILTVSFLGAIMGCFFMLFLLAPKKTLEEDEMN